MPFLCEADIQMPLLSKTAAAKGFFFLFASCLLEFDIGQELSAVFFPALMYNQSQTEKCLKKY